MAVLKRISLASVPAWLDELAAARTVYAPVRKGAAVVYRKREPGSIPELEQRPTESAKHAVFPRAEELFRFGYAADPEETGKKNLSLTPAPEPEETVIFGALSCDARGFFAFDPVYDGSGTQGRAKDTYYLQRRDKTALIVLSCRSALSTCFCTWTGGDPAAKDGADVLATRLGDCLLLEAVTEKGGQLLTSTLLEEADPSLQQKAEEQHRAAREQIPPVPGDADVPEAVLACFDNMEFWQDESASCLSCGACTYLCPTCYCFNITDEGNGISGVRLRSWDTCMSSLFTLEASGHNPRLNKAARLRNRVGHKFSYYPGLHEGRYSCCGCGRCIKSCPSSVDIRRIVQNAIACASVKGE